MKANHLIPVLVLVSSACSTEGKTVVEPPEVTELEEVEEEPEDSGGASQDTSAPVDQDGDGWASGDDCDDADPSVSPDAQESCNGVDDDCDGEIDEDSGDQWYLDGDGDGYGGELLGQSCEPLESSVLLAGDCADDDPSIHPGSTGLVDGQDTDCDGRKDWYVTIFVAVDDEGEICLNDGVIGPTGSWMSGAVYEVWLRSGTNTVGIHGWDTGYVITAAIAHLEISDGTIWVTDDSWRYDPEPDEEGGKQGWCGTGFDDSGWDFAQDIGPIGDPANPWGSAPSLFPEDSPAHWIWDHFPVELNSQYLRKEIELP